MPPTIKDIAQRVGKSIGTVSRALHDYDDISPQTKAHIRQVAAEMGYRPNTQAQRLQKRRSDTLGLILPTFGPRFSDPFFSEFIAGIGNKSAELHYDLLVSTRPPGEEELDVYRLNVEAHRVDGFILVRTRRQDARVNYLRETGVPFVAFGRVEAENTFPYVDEDGDYGMSLIIEHLAALGHKRVGVITAPVDLNLNRERLSGIKRKTAELGLSLTERYITTGDLTQRGGYQQAQVLLDLKPPPSAIVAFNDLMALGALSAAQERGLDIGREVSITGFDDIPMAEHSHPPLTTVHQPIYKIGAQVCEMLIQLIRGETLASNQVLLKPDLVVRRSTGPASEV